MRLKTPEFWYDTTSAGAKVKAGALSPFSYLYNAGFALHRAKKTPYQSSVPVLCIGNLVAGGSGKTPTAIALMKALLNTGKFRTPAFLSRGYGGSLKGPIMVDKNHHTVEETGDEPLLLATVAPVIIARDRAAGARMAEHQGIDLLIMDDGLQNRSLAHTLNIVVIDGRYGFGNKKTLPAGPLRETVTSGLKKTDAVIMIGADEKHIMCSLPDNIPVFEGLIKVPENWICDRDQSYIAFAGLGRPEKFYSTLQDKGLNVLSWHSFPDHHPYDEKDMTELAACAKDKNARLITTEKDAVRIPKAFKKEITIDTMPIHLELKEPDVLLAFLVKNLKKEN